MADIQFNDEQTMSRPMPRSAKQSAMVKLIIKMHLAKDQKSAEVVMLIVAAIAVVAALIIAFSSFWAPAPPPPKLPPGVHLPPGVKLPSQ